MIDAGKYKFKITIVQPTATTDAAGFPTIKDQVILTPYASVKTTRGYTLIVNNSDFEKAYTNFTIRYPLITTITRDMFVLFKGKRYMIDYINNIDEMNVELELQCKEVTH